MRIIVAQFIEKSTLNIETSLVFAIEFENFAIWIYLSPDALSVREERSLLTAFYNRMRE